MQQNILIDRMTAMLELVNETRAISMAQMQKMPYGIYLQTEHWKHFRSETLKFYQYKCQTCDCKKDLNVHHRNYDNVGQETFNDVIVLCENCHGKFHDKEGS